MELVKPEDRYDAAAVTIGTDGIATYSSSKKLNFAGTGVTPYYASEVAVGTVMLTSVATTWGYQGYIVKGAAGTYDVPATDEASYPSTNYLKATGDYAAKVTASTTDTYHYIFAKDATDGIGFYNLTADKSLAAHKAYLETTTDIKPSNGVRVMMVFDGETTGIHEALRTKDGASAAAVYDMQGRRTASTQLKKGIYIHNNKKYVVK